jgi:hypothetical protein
MFVDIGSYGFYILTVTGTLYLHSKFQPVYQGKLLIKGTFSDSLECPLVYIHMHFIYIDPPLQSIYICKEVFNTIYVQRYVLSK